MNFKRDIHADLPKCVIIAGPTGSGKSALALEIAAREGGVIVNADSLQLYQGLPLLTAQPSASDRARVPHFLYEVFPPHAPACSASRWVELVQDVLETHAQPDQTPLIVGGTGFYLQALTRGLSPIPPVPIEIREELEMLSLTESYEELKRIDPVLGTRLTPQDRQRIIRGLSVWRATGKPLSFWQAQPRVPFPYRFRVECLMPPREELLGRLEARLDQMVERGVFEEVKSLLEVLKEKNLGFPAVTRALGFYEIAAFWQGDLTRAQAIQKILEKTRQYAKRQMTWFRNQKF